MKQEQIRIIKALAEELILNDAFDFSVVSKDLLHLSASYNQQIRQAMGQSLSSDEAFDLLEKYDEINNEIYEIEREYCVVFTVLFCMNNVFNNTNLT